MYRLFLLAVLFLIGCQPSEPTHYDILIQGGTVYNGLGGAPFVADIGVSADTIAGIGDLASSSAEVIVDATGLAVSPGFINMLSWAPSTLIEDGKSQSDIRQGVTLEVFGEGWSFGPLNEQMKREEKEQQGDIKYDIEWTTLSEYLEYMEARGVSPNIGSFVGATTVRIHELGYEDRVPTEDELDRMRALVRQAMEEGAFGVGSSLIYAPAFYADTEELIELSKVAAEYDGLYVSHLRSEGNRLLESVDELITIAREAGIRAQIYHLKAAGKDNWDKLDQVFEVVEAAQEAGLEITADMYPYPAGATGLDAAMPPWVQEGGYDDWAERLQDPSIRERVAHEMMTPTDEWENLYLASGSAENVLLVGFKNEELKPLTGKSLAEVATMRGKTPEETAMDLVVEDGSRVGTVYFVMSEDNVRKKIQRPWISFDSDAGSLAPEGVFLKSNPHPRAYGTFARILGRYVREEQLISLQEAIRRLTSFPAETLKIQQRGRLEKGYFADIAIFDPDTIIDHATFENPHQYATGMVHVFVNGEQVLKDGEHTGALPGRVVRGPGWVEE
ncbi:MAG: D-aminoacylase [Rhodothermaceae bacterium]|nr:D-aminoacylase [Rhodothermaceae bacterium]